MFALPSHATAMRGSPKLIRFRLWSWRSMPEQRGSSCSCSRSWHLAVGTHCCTLLAHTKAVFCVLRPKCHAKGEEGIKSARIDSEAARGKSRLGLHHFDPTKKISPLSDVQRRLTFRLILLEFFHVQIVTTRAWNSKAPQFQFQCINSARVSTEIWFTSFQSALWRRAHG